MVASFTSAVATGYRIVSVLVLLAAFLVVAGLRPPSPRHARTTAHVR